MKEVKLIIHSIFACTHILKDSKDFTLLHQTVQVYSWTGENNYIVRGASSNLVIGSSDGGFGIWLDESFNQGRSQVGTKIILMTIINAMGVGLGTPFTD